MATVEKSSVVDKFVKATGAEKSDVLAFNETTGVVVTAQGGKFQVSAKGRVKKLSGPDVASEAESEESED